MKKFLQAFRDIKSTGINPTQTIISMWLDATLRSKSNLQAQQAIAHRAPQIPLSFSAN